jgi:hypothetical protein
VVCPGRQADCDRPRRGDAVGRVMPTATDLNDRIFHNAEVLARATADWLCEMAAISGGRFAICCSGGSTPRPLYELLAKPPVIAAFPWSRVHWFWGDERFVPHDHPDSNYGMTRAALLAKTPIPAGNIHPIPTEGLTPEQGAAAYERTLQDYYGANSLDGPPVVRRDASRYRWRWPHRFAVPRRVSPWRDTALGGSRAQRRVRTSHHTDLSGSRQQSRHHFLGSWWRETSRRSKGERR